MVYSGGFYDAERCHAWGLVDEVFAPDKVYEEACAAAARFAKGPALALRAAKQAIDTGIEVDLDSGLLLEQHSFTALFATKDAQEGMKSFVEQGPGKATFTGR
jgi:enoyl-CoA hydratase/carnithine racemase